MHIINLSPQQRGGCDIPELGIRGENEVTQVVFDFSAWAEAFGAGLVSLLVKRPGDAAAYPAVLTIDGQTATWTVGATDTAVPGVLSAEYIYTVDEQVAKTAVFNLQVAPDIGQPGTPPDPYEDWLEELAELGAQVQQDAADAAQSAQDAAGSADAAEEAASHYPKIEVDGYWYVWDVDAGEYVTTGVEAQGPQGEPGVTPDMSAYRTAAEQDVIDGGKLATDGDGSDVTVAFTAAGSRTAITTGEKLSVIFGKILKWLSDLGTAAFRAATSSVTSGSTDLVESGAVYTGLDGKVDKVSGKGLSTEDFSAEEKSKLAGIAAGAEVNVNADWNAVSGDAQILNKPTIPTVPSAYASNPAMDGTASPGSSGSWARGDHVHPTDTGRQAKITASGILKGDGAGGVSAAVPGTDYQTPYHTTTLTIASTDWVSDSVTVTVNGMTATALVFVEFSDTTTVFTVTQATDSLTITADSAPSDSITVKVGWFA